MTQPTFADGPPVPLMTEGVIDAATVRQLTADLESAAVVRSVREKAGPGYAAPDDQPLPVVINRLLSGAARAVQINYQYDGHEWVDTLLSVPGGFRLVRCRHEG